MIEVSQIITRFAPSPTGTLHIGGARTALFNWLFARHHQGRFHLRIEDTDRERSTPEAVNAIIAGLNWLELDWDGDIVFQSARSARHREVAQALLAAGKAYHCYCTAEELAEMREKARAEGRPVRYDGRWRDRDPAAAPEGVAPTVRLKAPRTGETVIEDKVQGRVVIPNDTLDDLVLLRSDGTPTYMLSVVVDDHDMAISHIIRGDDHLTNSARQSHIYDALDWTPPVFAHIPLIHGPDGARLSKRHGAQSVEAFRDLGYLPEAMRNYLLRLGWSHGDDEIISTEEAIAWFSLNGINKGAARLDLDKLNFVNGHYLRKMEENNLLSRIVPILQKTHGRTLPDDIRNRLKRALPELKLRAKTLVELADKAGFLVQSRPLVLTDKAAKLMTPENRSLLTAVVERLHGLPEWEHDQLDAALKSFAEARDLKFGAVAQPVRAAVTGGAESPGLIDVLVALGAEESLARLSDQVAGPRPRAASRVS